MLTGRSKGEYRIRVVEPGPLKSRLQVSRSAANPDRAASNDDHDIKVLLVLTDGLVSIPLPV